MDRLLKVFLGISIICLMGHPAKSQEFDKEKLLQIAENEQIEFESKQKIIKSLADRLNYPLIKILGDNKIAVLTDIVNGVPYYLSTHNEQARLTTGVDYVQSASGLNLSLFGEGITISVFDEGTVRATHVELAGRVQNVTTTQSFANHATHVTGTIAASGVNPRAQGMLPEVEIRAFYGLGGNDLSDIADEAAAGRILSNHSYGLLAGWEFENGNWGWYGGQNDRDGRFGFYSDKSRRLDEITFNAPKYTIVWSAGNDRSDVGDGSKPPDGPFDCITPEGCAKNVLTIGAITGFDNYQDASSAVMTDFSSWGPTDDGRIKPDLVADGFGVFSTGASADDNYTSLNGTSMSAPNVTGTLGMIQQYYRQIYGEFMDASMLKALAIHTAREAGPHPGPDYMNGWGVMNGSGAIETLMNSQKGDTLLISDQLQNGETHTYDYYSDGKTKITATIAWTERPGSVTAQGSTNRKLVNDLDIVLIDDEGNETRPWVLNLIAPGQRATRGDNIRDNVEKIEFSAPAPRNYKIVVSHKGNLTGGSQSYSLVITGNKLISDNHDIYWLANSGSVTSAQNWAASSGGEPLGDVNLTDKSLVFDNNSQISNEGEIEFNNSLSIDNLIWLEDNSGTIDLNGNTLEIRNMLFSANADFSMKNGTLIVHAEKIGDLGLNFNGSENLEVVLLNENPLQLTSGIRLHQLVVGGEEVMISDQIVLLNNMFVDAEFTVTESTLDINSSLQVSDGNIEDIVSNWNFNSASLISENEISLNSIHTTGLSLLEGFWNVDSWVNTGDLTIRGRLHVKDFTLEGGNLLMEESADLIIANNFSIISDENSMSGITSAEGSTPINVNYRDLLCFDFVNISDINFITESVINFGQNSNVSNVTNATNINCDDVVFASFELDGDCANSVLSIIDNARGMVDSYYYEFSNGQSSELQEPVVFFDEAGEFSIEQTVSNQFNQEDFQQIFNIRTNDLPAVNIIETEQGLVASLVSGSYTWYRNGEVIPDATSRTFVPELNGDYRVSYRSSESSCQTRVSLPYRAIVTSIDLDEEYKILIYPNPVQDQMSIRNISPTADITLYSITGKKIIIHPEFLNNQVRLNLSFLKSGVYLLNIRDGNKNIIHRLVKN